MQLTLLFFYLDKNIRDMLIDDLKFKHYAELWRGELF